MNIVFIVDVHFQQRQDACLVNVLLVCGRLCKLTKMKIEKVPLKQFIDTLVGLYNKGVDFIDMQKEEDALAISFSKEYLNPELRKEEEEDEIPPTTIEGKEDLNNLLI